MPPYEYRPGDEYRNIENALWILTAFRDKPDRPLRENQWLTNELKKVASDDPLETITTLSRLVQGFAYLSSELVDHAAETSNESPEQVIAVYRRLTEGYIAD